MNCVACKQPNAPERNYCGGCGTPLARYCSLCGFRNGVADRFCGGCGADVGGVARTAASRREAAAASTEPPSPSAGGAGAGAASMADLLQAAQESTELDAQEVDVKVSQDDIDSLFGE